MKKAILLINLIILSFFGPYLKSQSTDSIPAVVSAKDTAWKVGGNVTATFSQAYFDNWASGGENSFALNSRVNLFTKYQLNKVLWENLSSTSVIFMFIRILNSSIILLTSSVFFE